MGLINEEYAMNTQNNYIGHATERIRLYTLKIQDLYTYTTDLHTYIKFTRRYECLIFFVLQIPVIYFMIIFLNFSFTFQKSNIPYIFLIFFIIFPKPNIHNFNNFSFIIFPNLIFIFHSNIFLLFFQSKLYSLFSYFYHKSYYNVIRVCNIKILYVHPCIID